MPIERPVLMQPVSGDTSIAYSARELRSALLGSIFSREGVLDRRGGHLQVTQRGAGANMTVDVAPGRAAVFGDDTSDQGTYSINSTTVVNLAVPSPSQSTSRTHRVILRVRDRLENGSWAANTYDAVLQVQPDTNAAAALPPSTIPLATVTTPANATSVTNAMITGIRPAASVGTADVTGSIESAFDTVRFEPQASRPPRYNVNPDGWVQLGGWVRRQFADYSYTAHQQISFGPQGARLPAEILPPDGGYRDFIGVTHHGPVQYAVMPNGSLTFRFWNNVNLIPNGSWFSFDGCGWKL